MQDNTEIKRKEFFAKEKQRLSEKYSDKLELINAKFTEILSDGCSGCKSRRILADLFNQLGEPIPQPSPQQVEAMQRMQRPLSQNSMNQSISPEVIAMQSMDAPRPPCEECFKEHIASAIHFLNESIIGNGYPEHRWLAIADLRHASAEILGINPVLAEEVRNVKLRMIQDKTFVPDLMKYLK
jgi:hypothetical protein